MTGVEDDVLLRVRGIEKVFPGVRALKGIDFDVRRGEVHALVGENGAGKSTLMHILAGVLQPDGGSIELNGQPDVRIPNEHAAQGLGIAMVYQERSLVPMLSVAENIFAGRQPGSRWGIDHGALLRQSREILDQLGLDINPHRVVAHLSPAQQQMVEIAKALSLNARLMILDEPTSPLTETETAALFALIRRLRAADVGIVYISHRLEEVFAIADRVTVLKDGEYRGTFPVAETTPNKLISLMVGRDMLRQIVHHDEATLAAAPVVFEVRNLTDRTRVKNVTFCVRAGEILALSGLAGAGRTELALAIFGAAPRASGEIFVDGKPVDIKSPADAMAAGIGYVPEERRQDGLFLEMSVARNVAAAQLAHFGEWWVSDHRMQSVAEEFRQKLKIATPSVERMVQNLSGGNQQKVVLSRWLLRDPRVLIVDEPTRGIDVGAKAEVHHILHDLATRQGAAIVLISSELPEILAVADRILVMRLGRLTGELTAAEATEEKIMRLASTGIHGGAE